MFRQNLKIVLRNISRRKGFSFINIFGLAVGLAFTILILLWVQFETSFDKFHANLDRLHAVWFTCDSETFHGEYMVGALAEYLQAEYPEITHATRVSNAEGWSLVHDGNKYTSYGRYTDPAFFEMFSFEFVKGDAASAFAEPNSIVLTEGTARRIFGDEEAVGQVLESHLNTPLKVSAIMKDPPENTGLGFQFLVSCADGSEYYSKWDIKCIRSYVMLDERADHEAVSAKIIDVFNDHNEQDTDNDLYLRPLAIDRLHSPSGGGRITYVYIFSAIAFAVLAIACINFMNLSTARHEVRSREIGVKKVFGASRRQLIIQFLSESILTTLVALILAMVMVEMMLPAVNAMVLLDLSLTFNLFNTLALLGITLLVGIIAGSYPAFFLSSFRPLAVLKSQGIFSQYSFRRGEPVSSGRARGLTFRRVLVVGQFALSIMFIIAVVVILRQLSYTQTRDMGFDKDHIILVNMPRAAWPHIAIIKDNLSEHSNILATTVMANNAVGWQTSFGIHWEGKDDVPAFDVGYNAVDYDFAETFGLEMVHGRFFSREFSTDSTEAFVINEACARAMGVPNPVGLKTTIAPGSSWDRKGTIVGVIENFATESAHTEIRPFLMSVSETGRTMAVRVGDGRAGATMGFIGEKFREIVPNARAWIRFYTDDVGRLYYMERATGTVIAVLTLMAVFLSCLGLFGLAACSAERRTREIGIRKVMGASVGNIVRLLSNEFLILVAIANLIAWPIAFYAMNRWLENFVDRVDIGLGTFMTSGLLALAIALITVSSQAFRASRANPVDSLRAE